MPRLSDLVVATKKRLRRRKKVQAESVAPEEGSPYVLDEELEKAAQPNRFPTNSIAQSAMRNSGFLANIRNRGNRQVVDPEASL